MDVVDHVSFNDGLERAAQWHDEQVGELTRRRARLPQTLISDTTNSGSGSSIVFLRGSATVELQAMYDDEIATHRRSAAVIRGLKHV